MAFDDIDSLNALMTEYYYRYMTNHKRAVYYVLLIRYQIAYLRVNYLQIFQYNRFLDTKSSLNIGSISWSHQTIGNVSLIR